jgi:hypothetical protein
MIWRITLRAIPPQALQETVDRRRRIAEILNRKSGRSTAMIVACTGASASPPTR